MAIILSRKGGGAGGGGAPSGPAGGDLAGTYPNPTIADNAVDTNAIQDGAITALKLAAGLKPLIELFDSTLGGDAPSIDTGAAGFSTSLDALLIMGIARTSEVAVGSSATFTFNNDSGGNYDSQRLTAANLVVSSVGVAAGTSFAINIPGASAQAGAAGAFWIIVPSYAQTTFHKSALLMSELVEDTAADARLDVRAVRWRDATAISRIIMAAGSGNLLAGSRLTVYGI